MMYIYRYMMYIYRYMMYIYRYMMYIYRYMMYIYRYMISWILMFMDGIYRSSYDSLMGNVDL
jgi:hypothetical protein